MTEREPHYWCFAGTCSLHLQDQNG